MGFDSGGMFFPDATAIPVATVAPRLISANATLPAFDVSGVPEMLVTFGVHEYLSTALVGAQNDLTFIAKIPGDQSVTITYADPGGVTSALSVTVSSSDITVHLARAASAITTTAAQAMAAIQANADASALVAVALKAANDGTGILTALSSTPLAGPNGTNPTLDVKLQSGVTNTSFDDIGAAFTQATVAGHEDGVFLSLRLWAQWVLTIGGTSTPEFAFSITAYSKRAA